MLRMQNILVGLDLHHGDRIASVVLEEASAATLKQAKEVAITSGASITLCTVLELSGQAHHLVEIDKENLYNTVEDIAARDLENIAVELRTAGLQVHTKVFFGRAWEELTREALRGDYGVLIVGSRQRSSAARVFFGSTSYKLIRSCPIPVWVVKPGEVRDVREVMVASDFSDVAQIATHAGVAIAQLLNAKLFVVHALEFPFETYLRTAGVSDVEVSNYRRQMHEEVTSNINEQLAQTDYRTLPYGVKLEIVEGSPDAVLPHYVDDNAVDLMVIGTHGRSGFASLMLGNTAERVLAHVHCSLLAVKPADFVSPVKIDELGQ